MASTYMQSRVEYFLFHGLCYFFFHLWIGSTKAGGKCGAPSICNMLSISDYRNIFAVCMLHQSSLNTEHMWGHLYTILTDLFMQTLLYIIRTEKNKLNQNGDKMIIFVSVINY